MKIKRLINLFIPVSVCNFNCPYCYIPQCEGRKKNLMPNFKYSSTEIRKALSLERLGGACLFNICGDGETLLPKEVPQIISELLKEGHYIELVTNGTLTDRFKEIILSVSKEQIKHLIIKFSYHYITLKNHNMLEKFWSNVDMMKNEGCSFTIELVPHDELIPIIDEIINDCVEHVGAKPHVTNAYDYTDYKNKFRLNTKMSLEEYESFWNGKLDSDLFKFKLSLYDNKITKFCYAGIYVLSIDCATGIAHQCYFGKSQNVFDLNKKIKWVPIGKHCCYSMCFNAHALLTLGCVPSIQTPTYYQMRNRITVNGDSWFSDEIKDVYDTKLFTQNKLSKLFEINYELKLRAKQIVKKILHK